MSFNMTFKKIICGIILLFLAVSMKEDVYAESISILPDGEILILYADAADQETMTAVRTIVEILTYQSFQVTYAPASECLGQLDRFSDIICYKLERYPLKIINELYELEKKGQEILNAAPEGEAVENGIQIMFIGNEFLRDYLTATARSSYYTDIEKTVGKITYYFNDYTYKEVLAKEENYLFLSGDTDYSSGVIQIQNEEGYFCAAKGVLTHIPVSDMENNLIRAAFTREVSFWKWPYSGEPHIYAQYMVLDKVYPFQDPDKLLTIVNAFIEKKEPFVISVMPIYVNSNYPAMQHFCEVLRYAQNHGGSIMIHSPMIQMSKIDVDLVNEYMSIAIQNYMEHGIYPLGIQVPHNWLFNDDTIEIMSRFRTVLVSEEEDPYITADKGIYTNKVYKDGHQWIAPAISLDENGVSYIRAHSTAVLFNITEDLSKIEAKINACRESYVPLKNLWDIEHGFWTDEDIMTYKNHIILVNNKRVEKDYTPTEYEEAFTYNRNMLQRFSKNLADQNFKLMVVVIVVSVLFLLFILSARKSNKRHFLEKHMDEGCTED